jgi:hypothetical protein
MALFEGIILFDTPLLELIPIQPCVEIFFYLG